MMHSAASYGRLVAALLVVGVPQAAARSETLEAGKASDAGRTLQRYLG